MTANAVTGLTQSTEAMMKAMWDIARAVFLTIVGTIAVMGLQAGFVWFRSGFDLLYESAIASLAGALWWRWQEPSIRAAPVRAAASARIVALCVLCAGSVGLAQGYWTSPTHQKLVDTAARSPWSIAALLIAVGVVAPVLEEALFRGYLLSALRRQSGTVMSVLLSAALFAAVHDDSGQWMGQLAAGVVLACVIVSTSRMWLAVLTHSALNLSGPIWLPVTGLGDSMEVKLLVSLGAFVVTCLSAIALRRELRRTLWYPASDASSVQPAVQAMTLHAPG